MIAGFEDISRQPLAHLPTPLEPMPRLTAHLGGPRLWVKRDDCTGLGLGGNKVRKLEYLMAEALAAGADSIVTGGATQSNHIRQSAAAAAKLGLGCDLAVMTGRVPGTEPVYDTTGNVLLDRLFGARLHKVDWRADRNQVISGILENARRAGREPHFIAYGGSSVTGALGYVRAAMEIAWQAKALGFTPRAVLHASGSAGTQAGLVAGMAAYLPETSVIGIDIDGEAARVAGDVSRLVEGLSERLGVPPGRVEVVGGHAGPGYGVPSPAMLEAVGLAARLEGLVLDPVYTGKGLAGLIALIRAGRFAKDEDVVFVHTGGAPAVFAYPAAMEGAIA